VPSPGAITRPQQSQRPVLGDRESATVAAPAEEAIAKMGAPIMPPQAREGGAGARRRRAVQVPGRRRARPSRTVVAGPRGGGPGEARKAIRRRGWGRGCCGGGCRCGSSSCRGQGPPHSAGPGWGHRREGPGWGHRREGPGWGQGRKDRRSSTPGPRPFPPTCLCPLLSSQTWTPRGLPAPSQGQGQAACSPLCPPRRRGSARSMHPGSLLGPRGRKGG